MNLQMNVPTLPLQPNKSITSDDDFNDSKLGFEWNYLRNPEYKNYSLTEKKGFLRLKSSPVQLEDIASPTFVGRRQQHIHFTATTLMKLNNSIQGDEAGISAFMRNDAHYDLVVRNESNKYYAVLKYTLGELRHIEKKIPIPNDNIYLRLKGNDDFYQFEYSLNGKTFISLGKMNVRYLSSESCGGFTGVFVGLFATSESKQSTAYADYDKFIYHPE